MTYFVYVLFSLKDKKLYTGFSTNLERRIFYHNHGLNQSTKNRRPLILIFHEDYINKNDALRREKYLKTSSGKRCIKIILQDTLANINKSN